MILSRKENSKLLLFEQHAESLVKYSNVGKKDGIFFIVFKRFNYAYTCLGSTLIC